MADSDNNTTRVLRQRQIRHDLSDVLGLVLQSEDDSENSEGSGFGSDLDIDDFETNDVNFPAADNESTDEDEECCNVTSDSDSSSANKPSESQWKVVDNLSIDKPPVINAFSSTFGPTWKPAEAEPIEYFDRFFVAIGNRPSLFDFLVAESNKYFSWCKAKLGVLQEHSKTHLWEPVTKEKLRAFFGLLLNMGLIRKHKIEEYWNTQNYSQDTPMFRQVMKLDTFKLILRFFHASDSAQEEKRGTPNYDPQYKFLQVLEHFTATWAEEYSLGRDISIDETIVGFKGRHVLVNYIRIKKHHQWGPKEYNLADSNTGYVYKTLYHTAGMKVSQFGQPFDVCAKLLTGHEGKNHHLVVDNYYTSIDLMEQLLPKKIYVTGTIRSNRRNLPSEVKKKASKKGEITAVRKGQMLA